MYIIKIVIIILLSTWSLVCGKDTEQAVVLKEKVIMALKPENIDDIRGSVSAGISIKLNELEKRIDEIQDKNEKAEALKKFEEYKKHVDIPAFEFVTLSENSLVTTSSESGIILDFDTLMIIAPDPSNFYYLLDLKAKKFVKFHRRQSLPIDTAGQNQDMANKPLLSDSNSFQAGMSCIELAYKERGSDAKMLLTVDANFKSVKKAIHALGLDELIAPYSYTHEHWDYSDHLVAGLEMNAGEHVYEYTVESINVEPINRDIFSIPNDFTQIDSVEYATKILNSMSSTK